MKAHGFQCHQLFIVGDKKYVPPHMRSSGDRKSDSYNHQQGGYPNQNYRSEDLALFQINIF